MSLGLSLPLHRATIQGKCDEVLKLIDNNQVEIDQQDHEGTTALILACASNQLPVASLLLQKGANPNIQRHTGSGPLFFACQGGFLDLVELLLRYNAPVAHSSCESGCPFLVSCQNGHLKTVERLIQHSDTSLLEAKLRDGANGLFLAAQNGHLATVEFLLRSGIPVDGCRKDGTTALYIATQMAHVEVCATLLKAGANANIPREDGSTPLYRATQKGFSDVVRLLLESGKPSLGLLGNGNSALHMATANGDIGLCQLLIQEGADPTMTNKKGDCALALAQAMKNSTLLSVLQSCGGRKEMSSVQIHSNMQSSLPSGPPSVAATQSLRPNHVDVSSNSRSLPYARPPGLRYYNSKPYDESGCRQSIPAEMNSQMSRNYQPMLSQILTREPYYQQSLDSQRMMTQNQSSKQHFMYPSTQQATSHLQQQPAFLQTQPIQSQSQHVPRIPQHSGNATVTQPYLSHSQQERTNSQQQMFLSSHQQHAYPQSFQTNVSGRPSASAVPCTYRGQRIQEFYSSGQYR